MQPLDTILTGNQEYLTAMQQMSFSYLLGFFTKRRQGGNHQRDRLEQWIKYNAAAKRVMSAARALKTEQPVVRSGEIYINDTNLQAAISSAEQNLPGHCRTDEQRIRYCRGFLDASLVMPHDLGESFGYQIALRNVEQKNALLTMLFELRIYPRMPDHRIMIDNVWNLHRLHALQLDCFPESRSRVEHFLHTRKEDHQVLEKYYAARRQVAALPQEPDRGSLCRIAEQLSLPRQLVSNWTGDLPYGRRTQRKAKVPSLVRSYEEILKKYSLPNVYLGTTPVWRHEKLFIPAANGTYNIPPTVQRVYRQIYGFREHSLSQEEAEHVQHELEKYLAKDPARDLDFILQDGFIKGIRLRSKGHAARWEPKEAVWKDQDAEDNE